MLTYKLENCLVPIKVWGETINDFEEEARKQIENAASLPFVFHHVCLMPDGHIGYGAPIGGVLATKRAVVVNFVGVDIGCGMTFIGTDIPIEVLNKELDTHGTLLKGIIGNIKRNVPVGFEHHREKQSCTILDSAISEDNPIIMDHLLTSQIEKGYYQVGTLGGGNHFIELQVDENNNLGIMLHSGSRNFGKQICDYYNKLAKELNQQWFSSVDPKIDLAFLPLDSHHGNGYLTWMTLALEFAKANRAAMMHQCIHTVLNMVKKYTTLSNINLGEQIDIHHNYAAIENHFGENVIVHRKGAVKAVGTGIIPGSMGSKSYITVGLENPLSFKSCSHGAGRKMGRKHAREVLDLQAEQEKLSGILHNLTSIDKLDEAPGAYKDIDIVMENQKDLVSITKTLHPIAVIKG
jgi:tRNA-splicing ligase RtcB